MSESQKIQIKFEAKGDKQLISSINRLAAAQRNLAGGAQQFGQAQHLVNQRVSTNIRRNKLASKSLLNLKGGFAMLRNNMLLAAFAMTVFTKTIGGSREDIYSLDRAS